MDSLRGTRAKAHFGSENGRLIAIMEPTFSLSALLKLIVHLQLKQPRSEFTLPIAIKRSAYFI
jgi:hypothetical protein